MKKIDKLILSSFIGPFILTFLVVVFILLTQHMLKYFDDIVGKDLGWGVLSQLLFYFAVFMTPIALPLAVLLSSLMTFGNLGEHFELTAIKSAGISLLRALFPIFIFVLGLTVFAYYSNNYFVPKAALEAYSLLYDIKQKKPALDLKQGTFYNGIPDFSIKVDKKYEDGKTLGDVIIYDHRNLNGNKKVTLADSGKMYTFFNDRYLKLELFDGHMYQENVDMATTDTKKETLYRSSFDKSEFILDLSSFGLDRTDKSLFQGNRIMRNLGQLTKDVDSTQRSIYSKKLEVFDQARTFFYYHLREDTLQMPSYLAEYQAIDDSLRIVKQAEKDSIKNLKDKEDNEKKKVRVNASKPRQVPKKAKKKPIEKEIKQPTKKITDKLIKKTSGTAKRKKPEPRLRAKVLDKSKRLDTLSTADLVDSLMQVAPEDKVYQTALNLTRQTKSKIQSFSNRIDRLIYERNVFDIQWHKILANSAACIIMFLIGAPLGAIIKRGGLGIPVLVSILFFIIFYVLTMTGEKYAKQNYIEPVYAIWSANIVLLPIGLFFLRQARNDARIFEADFYKVLIEKFRRWIGERKKSKKDIE